MCSSFKQNVLILLIIPNAAYKTKIVLFHLSQIFFKQRMYRCTKDTNCLQGVPEKSIRSYMAIFTIEGAFPAKYFFIDLILNLFKPLSPHTIFDESLPLNFFGTFPQIHRGLLPYRSFWDTL